MMTAVERDALPWHLLPMAEKIASVRELRELARKEGDIFGAVSATHWLADLGAHAIGTACGARR